MAGRTSFAVCVCIALLPTAGEGTDGRTLLELSAPRDLQHRICRLRDADQITYIRQKFKKFYRIIFCVSGSLRNRRNASGGNKSDSGKTKSPSTASTPSSGQEKRGPGRPKGSTTKILEQQRISENGKGGPPSKKAKVEEANGDDIVKQGTAGNRSSSIDPAAILKDNPLKWNVSKVSVTK